MSLDRVHEVERQQRREALKGETTRLVAEGKSAEAIDRVMSVVLNRSSRTSGSRGECCESSATALVEYRAALE